MNRTFLSLGIGLVAVLAIPVRSEPLADLGAALAPYPAASPIRAEVEASVRIVDDEGVSRTGHASVRVEDSEEGLHLTYSAELLDRLRQEAADSAETKAAVPASEVVAEFGAGALDTMLDFAPSLADLMKGATVLEEQAATDAELARVVFRADSSRRAEAPYTQESELRVTLWLAADGVPTRVVTDSRVKAGRLFIHVTNHQSVTRELTTVGDRLVVARSDSQLSVSGLGQSFTRSVDIQLRVADPETE